MILLNKNEYNILEKITIKYLLYINNIYIIIANNIIIILLFFIQKIT